MAGVPADALRSARARSARPGFESAPDTACSGKRTDPGRVGRRCSQGVPHPRGPLGPNRSAPPSFGACIRPGIHTHLESTPPCPSGPLCNRSLEPGPSRPRWCSPWRCGRGAAADEGRRRTSRTPSVRVAPADPHGRQRHACDHVLRAGSGCRACPAGWPPGHDAGSNMSQNSRGSMRSPRSNLRVHLCGSGSARAPCRARSSHRRLRGSCWVSSLWSNQRRRRVV